VTVDSPELMHAMPADRRPAIWPWLVMPLIALTMFYCLDRLSRQADQEDVPVPVTHTDAPADSGTL
jgi:hypothetical protein